MHRARAATAAFLLALVAIAAVLPLAAAGAARKACHCAVRMACCEDGTCRMGGDEAPANGPEWRTCRREAPATQAAPLDAFERAKLKENLFDGRKRAASSRLANLAAMRPRSGAQGPATPPPRLFSF